MEILGWYININCNDIDDDDDGEDDDDKDDDDNDAKGLSVGGLGWSSGRKSSSSHKGFRSEGKVGELGDQHCGQPCKI